VVDDEPSVHRLLQQFLSAKGYQVTSVAAVDEAIALLAHRHVDALVLDVRMPRRSGLDVLAFVRMNEALRDLPVFILTGATLQPEEEALIASHKAYVFYKPEHLDFLAEYLARVTGR
jgi:CheY-like chemotaxis protein